MATIRQLLTLAFIVLIAYAAHIYDNSPMSPRPISLQFAEEPAWKPLVKPERVMEGEIRGPECLTFDKEGYMYTGVVGGSILRINVTTWKSEVFARLTPDLGDLCLGEEDLCGRALGMQFDDQGQLVFASTFGIQRVRKDGIVESLLTEVEGTPLKFANSLVVLRDGTIVFTDSTTRWTRATWRNAVFEAAYDGRVIRFHPSAPKTAKVIKKDIWFANGIAALPDESAVLYHELGSGSIHRLSLSTLEDKVILANFPGMLDNLHRSPRNTYLSAVPAIHTGATRALIQAPGFIRKAVTLFIPLSLLVRVLPQNGAFIEVNENGKILAAYRSPAPVTIVTDVTEHNGVFYFGSLENHYIGRALVK